MNEQIDKYGILKMVANKLNRLTVTGVDQMQTCVEIAKLLEILNQMLKVEDKNREEGTGDTDDNSNQQNGTD